MPGAPSYRYNSAHQLIFANEGAGEHFFFYDGENIVLTLDGNGDVRSRRLATRLIDQILADERNGETQWLLRDQVGTVRDVVNGAGTQIAHFTYSAFGEKTSSSSSLDAFAPAYTSREQSALSGMSYLRARWFDTVTGRFIKEDPLSDHGYAYSYNSPTLFTDPTGKLAAIEYGLILCDVSGTVLGFGGIYANFAVVLNIAAAGLEGGAVDAAAAAKAAKEAMWGGLTLGALPCGAPTPSPF
ncbi:MAG: RHS repeat-associated core domain-containing protein [Deltaproteobacteria bacterium]|nr:RHS repeat-associated core domain-containing protein [Deltaproteobacteria bacterium]